MKRLRAKDKYVFVHKDRNNGVTIVSEINYPENYNPCAYWEELPETEARELERVFNERRIDMQERNVLQEKYNIENATSD